MPIKDLSNRQRVPRLDKIRLGIRVQGEKSDYPKAVDYFVCPEEVRAVYGEQPKKLKIAFHSDDLEEIFPQYYKRYGSGTGLVCKGDGENAMTLIPGKKQMQEILCTGRECDYYKASKCTQVGNLIFMVRGIKRFGVYQLDTGSYNTILNINGGLEFVKGITNGKLKFVPLILEVIPQEVNPEGKKKTVYVLRIEADIKAIMQAMESKKPGEILILESNDEAGNIEEDLYPEQIVQSLKVTEKQLTRMWTMATEAHLKQEDFKKYLIEKYKINSSKELTKKEMDEVFEYLENQTTGSVQQESLIK